MEKWLIRDIIYIDKYRDIIKMQIRKIKKKLKLFNFCHSLFININFINKIIIWKITLIYCTLI